MIEDIRVLACGRRWRRTFIGGSALAGAVFAAVLARAGYKIDSPVAVDTVSQQASGSLASARNSADTSQYIGCTNTTYSTGYAVISCLANDAGNHYVSCVSTTSSDPNFEIMRAAVATIQGDANVSFSVGAGSLCSRISVRHYSWDPPKGP